MIFNTIGLGDGVLTNDTGSDILVSFDTVSLFVNVPVEVLEIVRNKLLEDDTLAEHLILEVDAIMECVIKPQTSN